MVVALEDGFHFFDLETGALEAIVDPEADKPGNRFNDGTTDPGGRFVAGTMPLGPREPVAALYRLWPDRRCEKLFDGLTVTNGCAFSPDGRTFYFADLESSVRTIWACDHDPDSGAVTNRRVFVDTHGLAGRPDGGTVDADGCYWMAGVGGWQLVRFTPDGRGRPHRRPARGEAHEVALVVRTWTCSMSPASARAQHRARRRASPRQAASSPCACRGYRSAAAAVRGLSLTQAYGERSVMATWGQGHPRGAGCPQPGAQERAHRPFHQYSSTPTCSRTGASSSAARRSTREAQEERGHGDRLAKRILLLGGEPDIRDDGRDLHRQRPQGGDRERPAPRARGHRPLPARRSTSPETGTIT